MIPHYSQFGFMKRSRFVIIIILFAVAALGVTSCHPAKLFLLSSEGIVTYNRNTGQFEMVWDYKSKATSPDTVYLSRDSLKYAK